MSFGAVLLTTDTLIGAGGLDLETRAPRLQRQSRAGRGAQGTGTWAQEQEVHSAEDEEKVKLLEMWFPSTRAYTAGAHKQTDSFCAALSLWRTS